MKKRGSHRAMRVRARASAGAGAARGSGFTLVEMLIAVAAVGLIAVGLGKLFEKTGETVRLGRRISNLNEIASVMERTMREDFSRMSRNGFLVIKHREVPAGDNDTPSAVALTADDLAPRFRRIDELVFFREGRFASKRQPENPAAYPIGSAARIYYGHGLRQVIDPTDGLDEYTPEVNDTNDTGGPAPAPTFGVAGPNQFASNWILLRHETALCPPLVTSGVNPPQGSGNYPQNGRWGDSKIQVGLQPAAVDVFGLVAGNYPVAQLPQTGALVRNSQALPQFASGIVDVAATDLSQVRARILNAQPLDVSHLTAIQEDRSGTLEPAPFAIERLDVTQNNPYQDRRALGVGERVSFPAQDPRRIADPYTQNSPVPTVARMKRWMIEAFPAEALPASDPTRERRMRCELTPPDLNGVVTGNALYPSDEAYRRTDQTMLSASNFVVGCTEFIVEWSYGARYPSDTADPRTQAVPVPLRGKLIWHGLPRTGDVDGDGNVDADEFVAHPYNSFERTMRTTGNQSAFRIQTQVYEDYVATTRGFPRRQYNDTTRHVFQSDLIHEPGPSRPTDWNFPEQTANFTSTVLFSCFGYVDPTFGYIDRYGTGTNTGDEPLKPRPGEPATVAVPWPTMIRVTVSLVEPSEPLKEQTYQFIFQLPREGDQVPGT